MSATQTGPVGHGDVLDHQVAGRHELHGVLDGDAVGERQPQDPAVRRVPTRQQVAATSAPSTAYGQLSGMSASCHHSPSVVLRGAGRSATRRRRPSARGPSASARRRRRTARARGSARRRGRSGSRAGRRLSPPRSRYQTCCRNPAGIGAPGEPEAGPVRSPRHRPAHQVHVRDRLPDDLAARDVVHEERAVLRAVLGHRHRDLAPARPRHEPVDRRLPRRVDRLRVDQHPLRWTCRPGPSASPGTVAVAASAPSARSTCHRPP